MAFPNLHFIYQAFIPQSVGRKLSDIFRHHPHFNRQDLVNYDEFSNFLRRMDNEGRKLNTGGNWIAEPPPISTFLHTFAMTNDGEFGAGRGYREHSTNKVRIEGSIDLREVGQMSILRPPLSVPPSVEASQCQAGIVMQTSDLNVGYPGIRTTTGKYLGVFRDSEQRKSYITGKTFITNKSEGLYFSRPGTSRREMMDTTVLYAKAAGSYPFIRGIAPDIDMELTVKLHRTGDRVDITFEGLHDQFPAYELVVNGVRKARWDPVANGQTGPNPINLHANYLRTQVRTRYSMSERVPYELYAGRKHAGGGLLGL